MRRVRYNVAASLDGYIARSDGSFDWIPMDPTVDFAGTFAKVDTILIGRRSYELVQRMGSPPWAPNARVFVFSTTLRNEKNAKVQIISSDAAAAVAALREETGEGEIWLFGGGTLFASLLAAGQVDSVEVTVVPILLGGGVPLLPGGAPESRLSLVSTRTYEKSGMVSLHYGAARSEDRTSTLNAI